MHSDPFLGRLVHMQGPALCPASLNCRQIYDKHVEPFVLASFHHKEEDRWLSLPSFPSNTYSDHRGALITSRAGSPRFDLSVDCCQ